MHGLYRTHVAMAAVAPSTVTVSTATVAVPTTSSFNPGQCIYHINK